MEGAPKQADRVNIVAIIIIGMIGALVVYASFTALQAFYNAEANKLEMQRDIEGRSIALHEYHIRQQGELTGYRMLEKRNQIVALPIERAMQLVIQDVRSGNAGNLVPAVGPHDTATAPVPVADDAQGAEALPPTEPAMPTEGTEGAATEGAEGAAPAGGAGDQGAAPAGGAGDQGAAPAGGAGGAAPAGGAGGAAPAPGGQPAAGQGAAAGNPPTVAPGAAPAANPGGAPAGAQ